MRMPFPGYRDDLSDYGLVYRSPWNSLVRPDQFDEDAEGYCSEAMSCPLSVLGDFNPATARP